MTAAPETWEGSVLEVHDERLEKALHVDFSMPGSKDDTRYQKGLKRRTKTNQDSLCLVVTVV